MNKVQRTAMYERIMERVEELKEKGYSTSAACGVTAVEEGVSLTHVWAIVNKRYKLQADGVDRAETSGAGGTGAAARKAD